MSIFDSQLNRGRFLLVLFAVAVIASRLVTSCGAGAADKEAARRTAEIRAALDGRKPVDLAPAFRPGFSQTMPGGPYDFVGPGPDGGLRAGVDAEGLSPSTVRHSTSP